MADFRKVLFAFAAVALLAGLTVPAYAQSSCVATPGVNTLIRSEGYTDLVGDIVLRCTGGIPTAANVLVPQSDILITLNTTITSRITAVLNATINSGVAMTEALLLMDEPNSTKWNNVTQHPISNCGRFGEDSSTSGPGVCAIVSNGDPNATYDGNATNRGTVACNGDGNPAPGTYSCYRPNVFQGRQASVLAGSVANTVQFLGIPYDAPAVGCVPACERVMRFTNIRVDGTRFGVASPFTTVPVVATISISNSTSIALSNTSVQVGQVQQGMSSKNTASTFLQCQDTLVQASGSSSFPLFGGATSPAGGMKVRVAENFPNAFRVRNIGQILANGTLAGTNYTYNGGLNATRTDDQNVPGAVYGTETGFQFAGFGTSANPPAGFGSPVNGAQGNVLASGQTGIQFAGFVENGTRIAVTTDPVPTGAQLYFPLTVALRNLANNNQTGVLRLVVTDANGANLNIANVGVQNTLVAATAVSPINGVAMGGFGRATNDNLGVYEVLFSDPNSQEYADIFPQLYYKSNIATGVPPPAVINASTGFAPFYTGSSVPSPNLPQRFPSQNGLPEPRFAPTGTPALLYSILRCQCDLLFPWVVGDGSIGYLTSIVVDNTSADPFLTNGASGTVTFNYYGTKGISLDPSQVGTFAAQTTTVPVPPGSYVASIVTNAAAGNTAANGLKALSGPFAGYVITQANFQFCHGVASISGGGLATQTYVGLEMDAALPSRTGQASEVLGH